MTIIFATTDHWLSRLIRWVTRSPASHVAIGATVHGVPVVIAADMVGVDMEPRRRWMRGRRIVAEYLVPPPSSPSLSAAIERLGEGYDYAGLAGYLPVMVARWFGRKIRNPWASPSAVVCSELVVRLFRENVPPKDFAWPRWDPETTTPEDLMSAIRTWGWPRIAP